MKGSAPLSRHLLSAAALLAMTPSAFAVDFVFSTGTFVPGTTAPQPLVAGQVLQINAGGNKFFDGVTFTNQSGLVNWNADTLYLQNGAVINNQSVWDAKSDGTLVNNGGSAPTFNNSGTFRKSGGLGSTTIGTLGFVNSGTIDAQTGTINFAGGNATFNAGSQFTGAGSAVISNNANFNGALTSGNLVLAAGSFAGSAARINGSISFTGGYLVGSWEVASGQSLVANSGGNKFLNAVAVTNNGTFAWKTSDALYLQNGSAFVNNGLHDVQVGSAMVNNGGPLSTYTNSSGATLQVAAGQTLAIGSIAFVNNAGTLKADGTINFGGGNATFNDATKFTGAGTNLVTGNASFNGAIDSGNLVLASGVFTGGSAVITGNVDFTGGYLGGIWQVAAGQTLTGKDGGNKFLDAAAITNKGGVQWQSGNSLYLQNGSSFDNQGTFTMSTGASLVNNGGPVSTFTNSGTLSVAAGQTSTVGSIAFVNSGTLAVAGTLNFNGNNANFNAGSNFAGAGVTAVNGNAVFNGAFDSTNLSLRSGVQTGNAAILGGKAELGGGYLQGGWTVASGATLSLVNGGNKFIDAGTVTNQGTIAWQSGDALYLQNGAVFANKGTLALTSDAAMVFNGGAPASFVNTGLIVKTGSAGTSTIGSNLGFVNQGVVDVRSGTIQLPANFSNPGTLTGTGTLATNLLTNTGHVAPGTGAGRLTLNGNFAQAASGFLDIELGSSLSFDQLVINGAAALQGTLALSCIATCDLHTGDVFVILDATGDVTGTFASVTTSGFLNGFSYSLIYDDANDLVKLAVLDAGSGSTAPVPEPQTWAMMMGGLAFAAGAARRRRRAS